MPVMHGVYLSVCSELPFVFYQDMEDRLVHQTAAFASASCARTQGGDANEDPANALNKSLQLASERLPRIPAWARLEEQLASTQQSAVVQRATDEFEVALKKVRALSQGHIDKGMLASVGRASECPRMGTGLPLLRHADVAGSHLRARPTTSPRR